MKSSSSFTSSKDVFASLMEHCKTTLNDSEKLFIRRVEGAPESMFGVGTEDAFSELEQSCCKAPQGLNSVITVDLTFNFGEFLKLCCLPKADWAAKIDMVPTFIHQQKVFSSYHCYSSSLVGISPVLGELKCFGTDGEHNLGSVFEAFHLRSS